MWWVITLGFTGVSYFYQLVQSAFLSSLFSLTVLLIHNNEGLNTAPWRITITTVIMYNIYSEQLGTYVLYLDGIRS